MALTVTFPTAKGLRTGPFALSKSRNLGRRKAAQSMLSARPKLKMANLKVP